MIITAFSYDEKLKIRKVEKISKLKIEELNLILIKNDKVGFCP